jgi:phage terminase large subunit GpA-like protein
VSTEEGRTWREIKSGSDSRIVLPCPYCQAWVTPERDRLVGWQEARHVVEAGTLARLRCSACGEAWSEAERWEANRRGRLLHKGQAIGTDGVVTGEVSSTRTLGFRFTAVNNLLMGMHRVAEEEWEAPRTNDPELAEKKLRQFFWALPSATESVTVSEIDAMAIAGRSIAVPRGRVPKGTVAITIGVDIGKWLCHWVAVAWVEHGGDGVADGESGGGGGEGGGGGGAGGGTPHVVEYGRLEVASGQMAVELAIQTALRRFRDEVALVGWPSVDGTMVPASLLLVDAGNWESAVVAFCLETGQGCLPTKGFGVQQLGRRSILQEPGYESVRQPQGYNLVEINADHWKSFVHARLQTPVGQVGGLTLFHGTAQEHLTFAKHLTAEKRVEEFVAGKGLVSRWEAVNRNNHFLDALALACVAGYGIGMRLVQPERKPAPPAPEPVAKEAYRPWIHRDEVKGWVNEYRGRW